MGILLSKFDRLNFEQLSFRLLRFYLKYEFSDILKIRKVYNCLVEEISLCLETKLTI